MAELKIKIRDFKTNKHNLFHHLIYHSEKEKAEKILKRSEVSYLIKNENKAKINIIFGDQECVDFLKRINKKRKKVINISFI